MVSHSDEAEPDGFSPLSVLLAMGFEEDPAREAVAICGTVGASIDWLMRNNHTETDDAFAPGLVDRIGAAAPDGLVAGIAEIAGWFDSSAQDSSQFDSVVRAVREMGFSDQQARAALQRTSSVEAAVEWLMEHGGAT